MVNYKKIAKDSMRTLSDVFPIDKFIEESQNINDGKFRGEWKGTKFSLIKDLREDKENGTYNSYAEAYRHAEKYITINGKKLYAKRLLSYYHKAKSTNKHDL
jgi:hypothetical protein